MLAVVLSLLALPPAEWSHAQAELRSRLSRDGFELPAGELRYVEKAVTLKLLSRVRPPSRFPSYADSRSLRRARVFLRQHGPALAAAERETGVPPPVVASILWVETLYGAYRPRYPALSTMASLAALSVPELARAEGERVKRLAQSRGYDRWESVDWEARGAEIGARWYRELKALLLLKARLEWSDEELTKLRSSWAGALGYGQFLPATALANLEQECDFWTANLWEWSDTIRLVARQVALHGWNAGEESARREAILRYNRLEAYADAVLGLAGRLSSRPSDSAGGVH